MTDYCKILKICHKIATVTACTPGLRIGQMLENVAKKNNIDLFDMSDEDLEKALDEIMSNW